MIQLLEKSGTLRINKIRGTHKLNTMKPIILRTNLISQQQMMEQNLAGVLRGLGM